MWGHFVSPTLLDDTLGYVDYFVGLVKPTNHTSSTGGDGTCLIPNFTNILRNIEIDEKNVFMEVEGKFISKIVYNKCTVLYMNKEIDKETKTRDIEIEWNFEF